MKPLFSIVMPVWNRRDRVTAAVDSVLAQTCRDFELIVADDGSTDGSVELLRQRYARQIATEEMTVVRGGHTGVSAARNRALAVAKGEWIAYVDSDNTIRSDFLARFLKIQDDLPELMCGQDFFTAGSSSVIVNFSACMFRKAALEKLPDALFGNRLSEIALAFHLERKGPVGFMPEPMSVYRQHAGRTFTGDDFIGRRQQEIACRETAIKVCDPRHVPDFEREIARIDEVIARRMERSSRRRFVRTGHWLSDVFRGTIQCYRDNGLPTPSGASSLDGSIDIRNFRFGLMRIGHVKIGKCARDALVV